MTLTIDEFYQKWIGKQIDYDGAYGYQCVDFAEVWMKEYLGKTVSTGTGYADGFATARKEWFIEQGCEVIENYELLADGDLVIWPTGSKHAPKSHVSVYYHGKELGQNQGTDKEHITLISTDFTDMLLAYRAPYFQSVEDEDEDGNTTGVKVYNTSYKVATKKSEEWKGEYLTTPEYLHMRAGAGTSFESLMLMPEGTTVKADAGYYTPTTSPDGDVWLYCRNIDKVDGVNLTGFVYSYYLKKKTS